VIVEQLKPNKR